MIKFCVFIIAFVLLIIPCDLAFEPFSGASREKNHDISIIGLFSLCQNTSLDESPKTQATIKTNIDSYPRYQKKILNSYLHFEKTVAFYQTVYNVSYGKIGSISFDVCRNQSDLMDVIAEISLSGKYFLKERNGDRFGHANYIAIYGFLIAPLLKLSLELLSWIEVPYFVILPDDGQISYVPTTRYQHLGETD